MTPTVTGIGSIFHAVVDRLLYGKQSNRIVDPSHLLPPPRTTAWERDAPLCPECKAPMFKSLVDIPGKLKVGEWCCSPCSQKRNEAQILDLQISTIHTLFPQSGQLSSRIHMANVRHALQERVVRNIVSALSTNKDLKETPEAPDVANLPTLRPSHVTTQLVGRDIERANTLPKEPAPKVVTNPVTPTPEARQEMFADVPDKIVIDPEDEEEEVDVDATERRRIVRKAASTREMRTEMLLWDLTHGASHEQSTGENERLLEKNWML